MDGKPYLIFSWHGLQYGIEVGLIQEMFLLPELTAIVEAPPDIVGILNLRSQLVPVMHLDLRLGLQMQKCSVNDAVVVLAWEELRIGIIANSIERVEAIAKEAIEPIINYGRASDTTFITQVAKVERDTILLPDLEALIRHPQVEGLALFNDIAASSNGSDHHSVEEATPNGTELRGRTASDFYQLCCPNVTPEDKKIFQRRAENLRLTETTDSAEERILLAAFALGSEYYGLDLHLVREFIEVDKITPIPCCPSHITGNINLRGEIVTLVDIRQALYLPLASAANVSQAIVIEVADIVAGLPVDRVFDVDYFHTADIKTVPTAIASGGESFLRGTVHWSNKVLSVLDLPKLLVEGGLEVNDEV